MSLAQAVHGGDVFNLAAELCCSPDEIVDFSANINPRGLPDSARALLNGAAISKLKRYPDWKRHPLRQLLGDRHNVPTESVALGAGASALILDSFRAIRPARCLSFVPAFAEYRRACHAIGAEFHSVAMPEFQVSLPHFRTALKQVRPELVVLNNPHNPSGSLIERHSMEELLRTAAASGATVLVDEAFIDYSPEHSVTSDAALLPGVIAVRSLTKFYGCPGLRVGYLVAEPHLVTRIEQNMPAWPIGTLALDLLECALKDGEYEQATLGDNIRARAEFAAALETLGLKPYPSSANFLLVRLPENWPSAAALRTDLLVKHRILIRDCTSFEGLERGRFIRLAVLSPEQNKRLAALIRTYA